MSDMLKQLYDQLEAKYAELQTAEAQRRELQSVVDEKVRDAYEAISDLANHDNEIASIWGEIGGLRKDIDSLTGT